MKSLILGLSLLLFCSSFTTSYADETVEQQMNDVIVNVQEFDDVRCRWRTCYYQGGELLGCSPWVYGECTIGADGSPEPQQ